VRFRLTEEPWKVNMGLGVENTFMPKKLRQKLDWHIEKILS